MDHATDAFFLFSENGTVVDVNQQACESLGYSRDELIGSMPATFDRSADPALLEWIQAQLAAGETVIFETRHRRKDGSEFPVEVRTRPFLEQGKVLGVSVARDITDRQRAEQERLAHVRLLESLNAVNQAIRGTDDPEQMIGNVLDEVLAILDCDRVYMIPECDPEAPTWSVPIERTKPEYPGAHALGTSLEMNAEVAATFRILQESDGPVRFGPGAEHPLPPGLSERFQIRSFMAVALRPRSGGPWQFGVHQCSSDRAWTPEEQRLLREIGVRVTDALTTLLALRGVRTSNELFRDLYENAPNAYFSIGADGVIHRCNRRAGELLGYRIEELEGRPVMELYADAAHGKPKAAQVLKQFQAGETVANEELQMLRADGSLVWISLTVDAVQDAHGDIVESRSMVVDITERKRAEQTMLARLRLMKFADTHALDDLLQATLDEAEALTGSTIGFYHLLDADQQTLRLQAWSTNTLQSMCTAEGKGRHYSIDEAGVWVECVRERCPVIHNEYASLPHRKGMPDGHAPVTRELVTPVFRGDAIVAILGVGNKPTDYDDDDLKVTAMLADFAWDIAERKHGELALEESEAKVRSILNNVGIGVALVSPTLEVLEVNRQMRAWFPAVDPGRHPVCFRAINHPPRTTVCVDCPTSRTLQDGLVHEVTRETPGVDGVRTFRVVSSPLLSASGEVIAAIEMVEDITERLSLEAQLRHAQKMDAVGRLAGGVAHDFNNMLGVIIGHAELALARRGSDDSLSGDLRGILDAAARSADLTSKLLAFGRKQVVSPEVLDLNEIVEGMLKMLRRLIGESIDLVWRPGARLWPIRMDPTQVDQILANLCVNARDAIAGVGRLTIETRTADIDETDCADHPEAIPGEFVVLAVSDDGCGMDRETLRVRARITSVDCA